MKTILFIVLSVVTNLLKADTIVGFLVEVRYEELNYFSREKYYFIPQNSAFVISPEIDLPEQYSVFEDKLDKYAVQIEYSEHQLLIADSNKRCVFHFKYSDKKVSVGIRKITASIYPCQNYGLLDEGKGGNDYLNELQDVHSTEKFTPADLVCLDEYLGIGLIKLKQNILAHKIEKWFDKLDSELEYPLGDK